MDRRNAQTDSARYPQPFHQQHQTLRQHLHKSRLNVRGKSRSPRPGRRPIDIRMGNPQGSNRNGDRRCIRTSSRQGRQRTDHHRQHVKGINQRSRQLSPLHLHIRWYRLRIHCQRPFSGSVKRDDGSLQNFLMLIIWNSNKNQLYLQP